MNKKNLFIPCSGLGVPYCELQIKRENKGFRGQDLTTHKNSSSIPYCFFFNYGFTSINTHRQGTSDATLVLLHFKRVSEK